MEIVLDVIHVEAMPDYKLLLEFENGEQRLFDMSAYINKPPFTQLKESARFADAFVEYGTVVWPDDIDIAPETLYDRSLPL